MISPNLIEAVTQADRDAAEAFVAGGRRMERLVQAFACHRLASRLPLDGEAVERFARAFVGRVYDHLGKGRIGHQMAWDEMHSRFKDQLLPIAQEAIRSSLPLTTRDEGLEDAICAFIDNDDQSDAIYQQMADGELSFNAACKEIVRAALKSQHPSMSAGGWIVCPTCRGVTSATPCSTCEGRQVVQSSGPGVSYVAPSPSPERGEDAPPLANSYVIGQQLFNYLRAFLGAADVDPSECQITVTVPNGIARGKVVERLRRDAPPMGEFGRASSAQVGNYGGKWQGVEYQFAIPAEVLASPNPAITKAIEALTRIRAILAPKVTLFCGAGDAVQIADTALANLKSMQAQADPAPKTWPHACNWSVGQAQVGGRKNGERAGGTRIFGSGRGDLCPRFLGGNPLGT